MLSPLALAAAGEQGALPWAAKLDPATLPTGSDRPWVSRSGDGLLVLKPTANPLINAASQFTPIKRDLLLG